MNFILIMTKVNVLVLRRNNDGRGCHVDLINKIAAKYIRQGTRLRAEPILIFIG